MLLKRLEIQGFKSFAEEIEIEFGPGITVIVGPNGCGKSNLTEAVQWVLGEQSPRALRGYKMDDVIFSGTSRRRPLGMAEVSLVFDNSAKRIPLAFEEVSITRRVYRSGESEYLINKTPCRLRDIQELLASCGIGRAAFSIVAQGKLDEFLSVKPEERRLYLEEAAGVGRYRQRKADALVKLGETEQALVRIQDILNELERQRAPLAEQAHMAKQYNLYKNNLRDLERRLLEGQLCKIREKKNLSTAAHQKVLSAIKQEQQKIASMEDELKELAIGIQTRKKRIGEFEQELLQIKKEKQEISILKVRFEEKLASLLFRKKELEARLNSFSERDGRVAEELRLVEDAYKSCLQSKGCIEKDHGIVEKQREEWENRKSALDQAIEVNNTEIFDTLHKKTALLSKIHEVENKKDIIARQLENLKKRAEDGNRRIAQLAEQINGKERLFKEQVVALQEILREREQLRWRLKELQRERHEIAESIRQALQQIERDRTRINILKEAEKNKDGYQKGVKAILRAMANGHSSCKGIIGLVEDLLSIDPEYETALQTALGRASHYLVCTSPDVAQSAIAYLKERGLGRASFLPLTAVDCWAKHQSPSSVFQGAGIIGRASELVSCDSRYRNIAEFLLGRTFFSEDLKSARIFAESNHYKVRVVTLDGDMIQPGGLITGGKAAPASYSHQRKKEMAVLLSGISAQEKCLSELRKREEQLITETGTVEGSLRELDGCCHQGELKKNMLRQEIAALKQELKQFTDFIEGFLLKGEEDGYHSEDLDKQISGLQEELAGVLQIEQNLLSKKRELEEERNRCESRLQEIQKQLADLKIGLVKLDQQLEHLEQKRQDLRNTIKQRQENQSSAAEELEKICSEIAGLQAQDEIQKRRLTELTGRESFYEHELERKRRQVASKEAFYHAKEKRYFKLKQITWRRQQEVRNIEVQLEHLGEQMEQIEARAEELGFALSPDALVGELSRQEEAEIKNRIAEYKEKLEAIGEVNLTAPAELQELEERYGFLMQQKTDLEEGRKRLDNMIKEMDGVVASRFHKTYLEVRKNFEEIYSSLCEGGKADLLLTDEKNLLTTGLDITVKPRGKKPRHLTLLSGGERALAGISFLFALLKTHSSPFYLLDEIEAFLDEANLCRFADFLKRMGEDHQLILISHRYQTMQVADTLYGVTMEEPGVSKVVSVRLSDWEFLDEARNTAS